MELVKQTSSLAEFGNASVCRTDVRKVLLAVSIAWTQYTSLSQVENDPAHLAAHAGESAMPRGNQTPRSGSGAMPV